MGVQKLYCSIKNLEEIIYFKKEHESIYNILTQFCDVILDIENDELLALIEENPILLSLLKRESAGVQGDKERYLQLNDEEYHLFLNDIIIYDNDKNVKEIRESYGILATQINDDFLEKQNYHFGYSFNDSRGCKFKSWEDVFNKKKIVPLNAAILIDNFLWGRIADFDEDNKNNLYTIFENLVSNELKVPFYLLVVVQNKDGRFNPKNAKDKINKISKNLEKATGVEFRIGILTQTDTKIFHERVLITNYHYINSDKGFTVFKNRGLINPTKGDRNWVFKDINNYEGEIKKHHHLDVINNVREAINFSNEVKSEVIFNLGEIENPILV